ncbi:MAG: hypothetical protein R3B09_05750 [Nannocystaceae bacterium]
MRSTRRTRVLPLVALATLTPALAQAQPTTLQNCVQGISGELPIGASYDPGYPWKKDIVTWLSGQGEDGFTWVEPVEFPDPVAVYGAGNSTNGNLCAFGGGAGQVQPPPWPALGAAERLHLEQLYLLVTAFYVPFEWFNHDPAIYTLDEMIDEANCTVRTPGIAWGDSLAFFAEWEYAGSPFRPGTANNEALKRRLAAWLGLQLIMLDFAHYDGSLGGPAAFAPPSARFVHPPPGAAWLNAMNDGAELSAQLGLLAWTFERVRDVLEPDAAAAMQEALLTYAERVHLWNPYYPQVNRGIRSTYGLYYVWEATQDPDVGQWYQAALDQFFDPGAGNWVEGGYWRDDYGLDLGYGGACLLAADRVLAEDPSPPTFVHDAVALSHEMIAHLALPDLDGRWVAPNPFNSRTSLGSITGVAPDPRQAYYGGLERYLLAFAAGLPFSAAALRDVDVLGPQGATALDPRAIGFQENLACLAGGHVGYLNAALTASPADANTDARGRSEWPDLVRSQDFGPPPTFLEEHDLGLLPSLWDQLDAQPIDALMPVERRVTRIRNFGDRLLYGRFGGGGGTSEYATVLHLGEVGQLPSGGESGLGGGQLASFWTVDGGPTLLGRRKGRNTGIAGSDDDWSEWRTFPVHSVFLRTDAGDVATSSLITTPTTSVFPLAQAPLPQDIDAALDGTGSWASPPAVPDAQATAALARARGSIPIHGYSEGTGGLVTNALLQPIDYQRTFLMIEDGLWVDSHLGVSDPNERFSEAWETFPIWGRDPAVQPSILDPEIRLYSSSWGPVDGVLWANTPIPDVYAVEILRGAGDTMIVFDQDRWAAVSDLWTLGTQEARVLRVDRLPQGCFPSTSCAMTMNSFRYLLQEQ